MLFGKLMPREGNFFEMFNQHADRIVEAARAFSHLVTNYNDPHLRGALLGLSHDSDAGRIGAAVLEGVAFALADGLDALKEAGTSVAALSVIGGGARSAYWGQIIAAALGTRLVYLEGGEVGPALGAAKLAQMATTIDSAALLTYRAAWLRDQGKPVTREAAMAKMTATEGAQQVIDAAVQIWGGMGVVSGHIVERLYREIRSLRIYEGATEVQQLIIARDLLKEVSTGSRHA